MTSQANPLRVMIVDDDVRIHNTIGMMLGNGEIDHISILPQKIEEQIAAFRPTVILLDLSMPTLDGISALGVLRRQSYGGRVIVMSGSDPGVVEAARRVGQSYGLRMAAAVQKPFRAAQLFEALRSDEAAAPATGVETEISRAFALNEFMFHYQPKFDLRTRALVGFESLARWRHPTRGMLAPAAFLPQVASGGLNGELARLALKDATARLEEWRQAGTMAHISINVGLDTAMDTAFVLQLAAFATAMSAPISWLTIELLETPAQVDLCAAAAELARLRLMGVGVSIDDFGTQSSSLARLQHLPANELKIDRSFVSNLLKFKRDQIIVRDVVGMARELGMTVVAEGIEDQNTLDLLVEIGCAVGQGYYLAKPMPAADANELLKQSAGRPAQRRSA
jgi:EAL domain-containing protein (putative c-di-GMP-specific phosphodiesterase class I)/ActR/RegA family two-component response regulator